MSYKIIVGSLPKFLFQLTEEAWGNIQDTETFVDKKNETDYPLDTFYQYSFSFHCNIVNNDSRVNLEAYVDMMESQLDELVSQIEEYVGSQHKSNVSEHDRSFIDLYKANWFTSAYQDYGFEIYEHYEGLRRAGLVPKRVLRGCNYVEYKQPI